MCCPSKEEQKRRTERRKRKKKIIEGGREKVSAKCLLRSLWHCHTRCSSSQDLWSGKRSLAGQVLDLVHWQRHFASWLENLSRGHSAFGSLLLLTGNDCLLFHVRYEMAVRWSLPRDRCSLHLHLAASCKWHVFSPSPNTSDQTMLRKKNQN